MQAYYEQKTALLTETRINFMKNTVKEPSNMTALHWHNAYEMLYVRSGTGIQQINSRTFRFAPGSVSIIAPGDVHTTVAESQDGCEIDVLQFIGGYLGPREDLLLSLKSTFIASTGRDIRELFDKIRLYAPSAGAREAMIVAGAISMLCGILSEYSLDSASTIKKTEFAESVCNYLRDADDVRLKTVAQRFGYSAEHFSRKFHTELGISYKHYCEKMKIDKILKIFDNTSVSLEEIANMLGYSDTSSFVRAFKRIYGITPGTYRKLKNQLN